MFYLPASNNDTTFQVNLTRMFIPKIGMGSVSDYSNSLEYWITETHFVTMMLRGKVPDYCFRSRSDSNITMVACLVSVTDISGDY